MPKIVLTLDIDGTLVRGTSTLDDTLVERVSEAHDLGWYVILATGRRLVDIKLIREALNPHYIISSEGATVSDRTSTLYQKTLPQNSIRSVTEHADRLGFTSILCCEDGAFVKAWSPAVDRAALLGVTISRRHVTSVVPANVSLLLLVGPTDKQIPPNLVQSITTTHPVSACISAPGMISVTLPGVDKGVALEWLTDVAFEEERCDLFVVAAGNSDNDIGLAGYADYFIAMADGAPGAIALANVIAPPIEEGGISDILKDLMLR